MKKLICMLLVLCLALSVTACTTQSPVEEKNETAATQASTAQAEGSADPELPGKGYKVGVIMANLTNSNYIDQANIYQEYLTSLGFEVLLTDCDNDTSAAVTAAENYATMECDALILSPMDEDVTISAAETAKSVKPDIVIVNSITSDASIDFTVIQSEYDPAYLIGVEAGKWINENQGGSAEVGVIAIFMAALQERVDGFEAGVRDTVTGEVTFNEQTYDSAAGRTGYEIMEDLMMGFPDVKCIFGAADSMCLGAFEAVKAAGVDVDAYAMYGVDGTKDALDGLKENSAFRGTADNGSSALAYTIADIVVKLTVDKADPDSFDVTIPAKIIDQSNVEGFAYDYNWVVFEEK